MNSLSIFSPSFADNFIDAFDRGLDTNFGIFAPIKGSGYKTPSVDVRETEKAYIMEIDLPGYTEKDVEINLKDRTLTVSSSHKDEKTEKKEENGGYIIRERCSRQFTRRFTLPQDIDSADVSAKFENGVLAIDIPKKPDTQPRQIEIKKL